MLKLYLDASIIVPFFVGETRTAAVDALLRSCEPPPVVSSLAAGEFASAISRLKRTGAISEIAAVTHMGAFDHWLTNDVEVRETEAADIALAVTYVRRFELGFWMPDAIHAATCQRDSLVLCSADARLISAAHFLGIDAVAID